jgi:NTP pyrophosphatase (non-canonical NTP hydrolase)/RNA binding exosome subunit
MYYIYHVFGKKIGVTRNITERVIVKQGYHGNEFEILEMSPDIDYVSKKERELQRLYGYQIDRDSYKKVVSKNKLNTKQEMKLNITETTVTFPCPVNKLRGQLMDSIGLNFSTPYGNYVLDTAMADWIVKNASMSMYNSSRSYVYNKALDNWTKGTNVEETKTDNINDIKVNNPIDVKSYVNDLVKQAMYANTLLATKEVDVVNVYDLIRDWALDRGIYQSGDSKTQYVKLMEEAGELAQAILKKDKVEVKDAIGDMIVVLTNLAHLEGFKVEDCITSAYDVIKNRKGSMSNGTFVKSTL